MAIRGLRQALGKSPEAMAQLVGCSSAGYEKWEQGTAAPSAQWLLRMLQFCPDEQTRNAFRIRAERRSQPRGKAAAGEESVVASRAACRDRAHGAVEMLYGCAENGDPAAEARLRQFAESLDAAAEFFRHQRVPQG